MHPLLTSTSQFFLYFYPFHFHPHSLYWHLCCQFCLIKDFLILFCQHFQLFIYIQHLISPLFELLFILFQLFSILQFLFPFFFPLVYDFLQIQLILINYLSYGFGALISHGMHPNLWFYVLYLLAHASMRRNHLYHLISLFTHNLYKMHYYFVNKAIDLFLVRGTSYLCKKLM